MANILVVEDNDDVREMMTVTLQLEGHHVRTAVNGRDALEQLRTGEKPSLILLDLMMPVMNGWEFMHRRQEQDTIASIPVVVISADRQAREKAAAIGAADCLEKPIDLNRLIDTVQRYCAA